MSKPRQPSSIRRGARVAFVAACAVVMIVVWLWCAAGSVSAQEEGLTVTASFGEGRVVGPDTPIELRLNRALKPDEGRAAVVIGRADVTSLFIVTGTRLVYSPALVPLPLGQSRVVVYLVRADGAWIELAHFTLQVVKDEPTPVPKSTPTPPPAETAAVITTSSTTESTPEPAPTTTPTSKPADAAAAPNDSATPAAAQPKHLTWGFEKMSFVPSLTIAVKSQLLQLNFPASTRPTERATFNDVTMQLSLRSESARGPVSSQTQFDFAGSSFQQEALRFGTLGDGAPQIDLASYLMQFQVGRAKFALGHTSYGGSRHLVNGFSSRGLTLTLPITKRFDFSATAMNGTNVVGYGNFFGLSKRKHQLLSGTLGVELFPSRPGGLRVEFSALSAYIQALNSFSQGSVNDVERSKGGSVRLLFTDRAQRFKFDGGFTRSQFRNPADPLLYQGTNTLAVPNLTRNARYVDVSYDVLRGFSLTKSKQVSLSLAFRHEQVDPLFRSLGASAQADKRQNEFQLSGSLGEISVQAGHTRFNDNLRHIASILQSLTRATNFSVSLPTAALWGGTSSTSNLLPRLSYSYSRTHQFGSAIPTRGGFETDLSAIPDQFNTNQNASLEWQFKKMNFGYSYNRSFTNNEQIGRERSDFLNQTSNVRAGFNPSTKLNLTFDLSRDSANDLEGVRLLRTWRVGTTATWNLSKSLLWTASVSNTIAGDRAQLSGSRNTEFDTQLAYHFGLGRHDWKKVQTQMFIRYADRYGRTSEILFGITNLTRVKIVNAGLTLTFF